MIKAIELRIGNWVKHNGEWSYRSDKYAEFYFKWDERDWFALGECTMFLEHLDPIPLTSEILHKSGFVFSSGTTTQKEYYQRGGIILFEYLDCFSLWIYTKEIKYLHQLQNLIFDLTGEELIVNL